MLVGVISDTHSRMHRRVFELFDGVDHIIHAGDIGEEEVLIDLRALAPVTVVQGNIDAFGPCAHYPERISATIEGVDIHLIHQVAPLEALLRSDRWTDDEHPRPQLLIYGHSHQGRLESIGSTLLFNPGSAGPRRFQRIPSVGLMTLKNGTVDARLIALETDEQPALEAQTCAA